MLLTGIMFKSGRYESEDDIEYAMLTTITLSIIGASTCLFIAVILYEARRSIAHFREHQEEETPADSEVRWRACLGVKCLLLTPSGAAAGARASPDRDRASGTQ